MDVFFAYFWPENQVPPIQITTDKVTYPRCSEWHLLALIFYAGATAILAAIFFRADHPAIVGAGIGSLLFSVALIWRFFTEPRSVEIDFLSGLAIFRGPTWSRNQKMPTIEIARFSSVYATYTQNRIGITYHVGLTNARGENAVIISGVDQNVARNACELLANRFLLTNRGLV